MLLNLTADPTAAIADAAQLQNLPMGARVLIPNARDGRLPSAAIARHPGLEVLCLEPDPGDATTLRAHNWTVMPIRLETYYRHFRTEAALADGIFDAVLLNLTDDATWHEDLAYADLLTRRTRHLAALLPFHLYRDEHFDAARTVQNLLIARRGTSHLLHTPQGPRTLITL